MRKYSKEHDAYYDDEKNIWLEDTCGDADCAYCEDRPETPKTSSRNNTSSKLEEVAPRGDYFPKTSKENKK